MDGLADDKSKELRKYRWIPVIASLVIAGLYNVYFAIASFSSHTVVNAVQTVILSAAAYYHLKHLIIPDVEDGLIRSIRPFNLVALIYDILWVLIRGLGSGLVHGICTVMVGYGLSYIRKSRKLSRTGTYALLTLAIIYHAIYNLLVQSPLQYAGILLPLATYIPAILLLRKKIGRTKKVFSPLEN